jgi:hypothetical protein
VDGYALGRIMTVKSDSPPDTGLRRARPSASEFLDGQDFVPARNDVGAYIPCADGFVSISSAIRFSARTIIRRTSEFGSAVCCLDTS